jgi:hypothetical protein
MLLLIIWAETWRMRRIDVMIVKNSLFMAVNQTNMGLKNYLKIKVSGCRTPGELLAS